MGGHMFVDLFLTPINNAAVAVILISTVRPFAVIQFSFVGKLKRLTVSPWRNLGWASSAGSPQGKKYELS